jgi:hypothetical protein
MFVFAIKLAVDAIEMFRETTFAQNWILIFYWNIYRTTVRHNKFVNNWNESFCWTWMSYQAMLSCFNLGASCWFRVKLFDLTFMTSFRGKYEYFKLYSWNYLPVYCALEWHKWIETSIDRFFLLLFLNPQENTL